MMPTVTNLPLRPPDKPKKFNLRMARVLAEYASRAYDPTPATRMKRGVPWSMFIDSTKTDARVLMECTGPDIVISFRGTTKNIEDWVQDLKAELIPVLGGEPDEKVHLGFDEDARSLYEAVVERLDRYRLPIFITGHSRGAADAAVFAAMLGQISTYDIRAAYLFACPRPGNSMFKGYFNRTLGLKPQTYRVAMEGDLVPHVPPAWDGFRGVGNEVFFTPDGKYRVNPCHLFELWKNERRAGELLDWSQIAEYHSIDRSYLPALDKALSLESSSSPSGNSGTSKS